MSDTNADGTQVDPTQQPPQGGGTEPTAETGAPNEEPFDKDRAMATIKNLREIEKKAQAQQKELADLRQRVKAEEDAKLSEQERLTKRAAELEAALSQNKQVLMAERAKNAILEAASKYGVPVDIAEKQFFAEFDEEGNLKREKLMADVKKFIATYPQLVQTQGGSGGNPQRGGQTPQDREVELRALRDGPGLSIFDPAYAAQHGGGVKSFDKD